MESTSRENRLFLALQTFKNGNQQSVRSIAKIYNVSEVTLRARQSRRALPANSRKLTNLEESVLIQEIIDLDS